MKRTIPTACACPATPRRGLAIGLALALPVLTGWLGAAFTASLHAGPAIHAAPPARLRAAGDPPVAVHVVDRGFVSASRILEGGRKLVRHDCPEGPDNLEAAYLNDTAAPFSTAWSALSRDDGSTWNPVGPLGPGPDRAYGAPALGFCAMSTIAFSADTTLFLGRDTFGCLQTWPTVSPPGCGISVSGLQQALAERGGACTIYWSFFTIGGGNPYVTWFRRSTDGGGTWSDCVNFTDDVAVPAGFEMAGMDGALSMDARGDAVAALAAVALDPAWASSNGFRSDVAYPAFTLSVDGGETWSALELLPGNDPSTYPRGHSGDAAFDSTISYTGGMGPGLGFTASRYMTDNVAIDDDGRIHVVYTLNDVTYGYTGVFHSVWEDGAVTHVPVGFPEDSTLSDPLGAGLADRPSVAKGPDGAVVIGWTEYTMPDGTGDLCLNVVPAGGTDGTGPVNVTRSPEDDEFAARLVDRAVPVASGADSVYVDWLFVYIDPSTGAVRDSTLRHLQTRAEVPPPAGVGELPPRVRLPRGASLLQNAPNPFNPSTTIRYRLEAPTRVTLRVFDLRGRLVCTLVEGRRASGEQAVAWDGRDGRGSVLPGGVYLCALETDSGLRSTRKMVLLK